MVSKKYFLAVENKGVFDREKTPDELSFLNSEKASFIRKLPADIIRKAKSFINRNGLIIVAHQLENKKPLYRCCESCLNSYLINKIKRKGLKDEIKGLIKIFGDQLGHGGYYLDNGRLVRVDV